MKGTIAVHTYPISRTNVSPVSLDSFNVARIIFVSVKVLCRPYAFVYRAIRSVISEHVASSFVDRCQCAKSIERVLYNPPKMIRRWFLYTETIQCSVFNVTVAHCNLLT